MATSTANGRRGFLVFGAAALLAGPRGSAAGDATIQQPAAAGDAAFIERAFALRELALANGDQGYGAVVARGGRIVGQAESRVLQHQDPTAHAEMEAIRDAAARLGSRNLDGCVLYSSSPACPMCEAAAYWAGIERLVYGRGARDGGRPSLC